MSESLPSKLQLITRLRSIHDLEHDETEAVCEEAATEIERLTAVIKHAIDEGDFCQECAVARYILRPGIGLPAKEDEAETSPLRINCPHLLIENWGTPQARCPQCGASANGST